MLVDIFHDTACPWCRIGIQHFFEAIAHWQESVVIRWHPFLLDQTIPVEGIEFHSFMTKRKGIDAQALAQLFDYTQQKGQAAGVTFNFDKISLAVNTVLSHQLIAIAPEPTKKAVVEAVYRAYFEEGLNIASIDVLVSIGQAIGINSAQLQALNQNAVLEQVLMEATSARHQGICSVPTFILSNKIRVDGSQSVEVFRRALNRASLLSVLNPPYWS